MKKRINISIDQEVWKEAKKKINNLSAYLEKCLKNLTKTKKEINKEEKKSSEYDSITEEELQSMIKELSSWRM